MENSRFFSLMVIGDNPQELIEKYSFDHKTDEPYIKYEYLKADKYLNGAIKALDGILTNFDKIGIEPNIKESLSNRIKVLKKMTPFEYYRELTNGMYYDENGNALTDENPNRKYKTARIGRNFALPLILKDGGETYSARCGDIDWNSMNSSTELYEAAWEMVVDGREPKNENEEKVYESMKDKTTYFSKFENKEEYVLYSTSYWNYAVVDKNGWYDIDEYAKNSEIDWVKNFYKNFIEKLNPNDLITIYECSVNNV
jgi:hypothetical protein